MCCFFFFFFFSSFLNPDHADKFFIFFFPPHLKIPFFFFHSYARCKSSFVWGGGLGGSESIIHWIENILEPALIQAGVDIANDLASVPYFLGKYNKREFFFFWCVFVFPFLSHLFFVILYISSAFLSLFLIPEHQASAMAYFANVKKGNVFPASTCYLADTDCVTCCADQKHHSLCRPVSEV